MSGSPVFAGALPPERVRLSSRHRIIRAARDGDQIRSELADTGCGIIQNHGGRIDVSSEIGVGTTFRITLPIHAAPAVQ